MLPINSLKTWNISIFCTGDGSACLVLPRLSWCNPASSNRAVLVALAPAGVFESSKPSSALQLLSMSEQLTKAHPRGDREAEEGRDILSRLLIGSLQWPSCPTALKLNQRWENATHASCRRNYEVTWWMPRRRKETTRKRMLSTTACVCGTPFSIINCKIYACVAFYAAR